MALVDDFNTALNAGREGLLSQMSRAPEAAGIQSIFWVVALLMAVMIFMKFRKGGEERKGLIAPFAILVFCLSIIFGFNIVIIALIIMLALAAALIGKVKQGEWKGVMMILVALYILGFIVAVKPLYLVAIIALVSALAYGAKHANYNRTYGTSQAAKIMKEEGYPVRKERKIIKGLERITRRGYDWSKDKTLRTQAKLKQRFAEREVKNLEEQEHEAEVAAAGKKLAETIEGLENKEIELQHRDMNFIAEILRRCQVLRQQIQEMKPEAVDAEKRKRILGASKEVLDASHALVKASMEEERLREQAGRIFETCMESIHHSSDEAKQLKESRREFKEIKKAADVNIRAIKGEIARNLKGIAHAEHDAAHSKAEGAHTRIGMLKERQKGLEAVDKKLGEIDDGIRHVMKRLAKVNLEEDNRIKAVDAMNERAERHQKALKHYQGMFKREDKRLEDEYKKFAHMYAKEGIPDEELTAITDSTILLFGHLHELSDMTRDFNQKELKPMVAGMAEVTRSLSFLSKISEYLTKMYYRLSRAMEELNKMAQIVDQNAESKEKLAKILKTEDLEQQLTKRAYRKGRQVVAHIKSGYETLVKADHYVDQHDAQLDRYVKAVSSTKREVGLVLNEAFKIALKREIKQAGRLMEEANRAETEVRKAKRAEMQANQ
ncbi:MAG: hypothetical protein ACE5DM_00175 [Candidatus Nanoarchaeia archaeon]